MVRLILALALASIAGGSALAQEPVAQSATLAPVAPDPMASAECQFARQKLQAAQAAAPDVGRKSASELRMARERAALACFGRADSAGFRAPQPAVVVPPTTTVARPAPAVVAPPPPVTVERLSVITSCDPGGCWSSDGIRLHRAGPNLQGPRGLCTVQGNVLICP